MGFFNDLTKKTSETTSKITKETKLKLKISENKGKINDLYEEIGKKVYENHIKEIKDNNNDIEKICKQIDEICIQIEEARKEILTLNKKRNCPKCFAEIDTDFVYCPKCGERQEDLKNTFEKAEEKIKEAEILPKNEEKKETVEIQLEEKTNKENKK